jgi:hypothetical protein
VLALVWLSGAVSGIVFAEPAPVDVLLILLTFLLPAMGMAPLTKVLVIYATAWFVVAGAGFISSLAAFDLDVSNKHVIVTFYPSMSSVILAAYVRQSPHRSASLLLNGTLLAAIIAALAAIVGYFGAIPSLFDLLTEFGRARGTFKDPNVFGAFSVLSLVYCVHLAYRGRGIKAFLALIVAGLLSLGVLLSFSRGAWSNAGLSLAVLVILSAITARSSRDRLRLISMVTISLLIAGFVLLFALQSDSISKLMSERAQLTQSYDVGPNGRFGGHEIAKSLIITHPAGIGSMQFSGNYHNEDVHEVYYNMLLAHGWVGGAIYILIVIATLAVGFKAILREGGAQSLLLPVYSAYVGTVGEGFIIDTDHWRHFYLLLALVWGLALSQARDLELEWLPQPRQTGNPSSRLRQLAAAR